MIEVRDLTMRGAGRPRLNIRSAHFVPGHVYGLIGPNGSGKSSLLSVLAGFLPVDKGALRGLPWQRREIVGVVFDNDGLHPGRTVKETLLLRAAYVGGQQADVADAVQRVGLEAVARRRVKALSLGMRMRLAIATALMGSPALVLLDEPMNGLDPDGIVWLMSVIRELRDDGVTVIASSHLLAELETIIDTAVIMSAGEIVAFQPVNEMGSGVTRIEVDAPVPLLAALRERGIPASREGGIVLSDCPVPELTRLAVAIGVDVQAVAPVRPSLETLYRSTVSAEHRAGGSS